MTPAEQAKAIVKWAFEDPEANALRAVDRIDALALANPGDNAVTDAGKMIYQLADSVR